MWHVEINESALKSNKLTLTIVVKDSLFLKHLTARRELYPTYLKYNISWLTPSKLYQAYVTPFPEAGGLKIRINEPMTLILPLRFAKVYKNSYEESIVINLLKWLDEEYKFYQADLIKQIS